MQHKQLEASAGKTGDVADDEQKLLMRDAEAAEARRGTTGSQSFGSFEKNNRNPISSWLWLKGTLTIGSTACDPFCVFAMYLVLVDWRIGGWPSTLRQRSQR